MPGNVVIARDSGIVDGLVHVYQGEGVRDGGESGRRWSGGEIDIIV